MSDIQALWVYMQEDMKADAIGNELRSSPIRQKLEKTRDFIMQQKTEYDQMEEQVAVHTDRKDAIADALKRAQEQLTALAERFEQNPPEDREETAKMIAEADKCRRTLMSYEQELRHIQKLSNEMTRKATSIRADTAKARKEFDLMKEEYNAESESKKKLWAQARKAADAKAEGIPEELMAAYNAVKKHIAPPMARLRAGQCSGCNTSQPSAALRKIDAGQELVECETCGRILIKGE